ncbi:transposase [Microbacterium sp. NPDC076768]|uniref:transposase n=1 Tax=Microbacterium sp. NPDC076768 TaxID=3154858 RepID=UPI00344A76B8
MPGRTFEEIAVALYSAPLAEFVGSRKARASEVDDAELDAQIRALRKPSIAAWVVNVFAQERASQLGEALRLARELREAQKDLDAAALAKLNRDRRALTTRLAGVAAEVAASRGEKITPATREAVEQSISAAFYDPAAAAAVASGRLVRALDPSVTATDIRDAVVGDLPELKDEPPQRPDELQARRARREAERLLAETEKEHAAAQRDVEKKEAALERLRAKKEELSERAAELEAQLTKARAEADSVNEDLPAAEAERKEANKRVAAAARDADRARESLESLASS